MYRLKIITSTVRPGRKGPHIAEWITNLAKQHGRFEVKLLDLAAINLPMMNEPNHPSLKKYEHAHTKKWSDTIEAADAFIFVTAEYDYNYPAPLRNALEYLFHEWAYKPAGIVSYGGISGGTRATNSLKSDLAVFKTVPLQETVHFPFFTQNFNDDGVFVPKEIAVTAAKNLLDQLVRWTAGLQIIKENK